MLILNIAAYQFFHVPDPKALRQALLAQCQCHSLKGTILLSEEGVNLSLAGEEANVQAFKQILGTIDPCLVGMTFRESYSEKIPFQRLKVKVKKEIITLKQAHINPTMQRAPAISPETLKQWLDEGREVTLLDTRNDYEMDFGTFHDAVNLHLGHFSEFPEKMTAVKSQKPIVMFCTGGIRCEKAALQMLDAGYADVYQLDGGILNYFAKVGGAHYQGRCFVFDERVSVDATLKS